MHDGIRDRMFLETDLRNAALREEFVLHYQPKVSCDDGRITGAEALLRWDHPRRGIVPPDQFIPLLEETGLIVTVGRWVLREACRQAVEWQRAGLELPSISVNLSGRQLLSGSLQEDIVEILAESGLAPACLDLEITESMLMQNAEGAIRSLSALKAAGVSISLDDFGTGYSSLAYLKRFPLDAIKVDRAFVQDITADADDASITRAVITMAHHLKLKVVAEGVETAEQLALLISHQCDMIQGYFFSRPLVASEMTRLLATGKRLPGHLLHSATRQPVALFAGVLGGEDVVAQLEQTGYRIGVVGDVEAAMLWLAGNQADVLVCAAPDAHFDAATVIREFARNQPRCERILLVGPHAAGEAVDALCADGLVHRLIRQPFEAAVLRQMVEEGLERRRLADDYGRLSHQVDEVERKLLHADEERSRLEAENRQLQATEIQGYRILQEMLIELPWPVLGIDDEGMLVLINDAAAAAFAGRGLDVGGLLQAQLPELPLAGLGAEAVIDGKTYHCRWRELRLGREVSGQLLLLEGK
jgi:EAL domain-containing protein (putative c-di-GMP-specific phosphodiesterase class I)